MANFKIDYIFSYFDKTRRHWHKWQKMKSWTRRYRPPIGVQMLQQLAIQPTAISVLFWIFWLGLFCTWYWSVSACLGSQSIVAEQQRKLCQNYCWPFFWTQKCANHGQRAKNGLEAEVLWPGARSSFWKAIVNLPWMASELFIPQSLTHAAVAFGPIWLCEFGSVVLHGCTSLFWNNRKLWPSL